MLFTRKQLLQYYKLSSLFHMKHFLLHSQNMFHVKHIITRLNSIVPRETNTTDYKQMLHVKHFVNKVHLRKMIEWGN